MRVAPVIQVAAAFAAGSAVGTLLVPSPPIVVTAGLVTAVVWRVSRWAGLMVATGVAAGLLATGASGQCHVRAGRFAAVVRVRDAPGTTGRTTGDVLGGGGCRGRVRLAFAHVPVRSGGRYVVVGVARSNGLIRVDHLRALRGSPPGWYGLRDRVRARITDLYGPRTPLVEALVLGRREDLDRSVRDRFATAGLAHLLAISGLHIGILAGWIALGADRLFRTTTARLLAVGLVWPYIALLGFPPSAARAGLFLTVAAVARLRNRHPPLGAVVAVAVLGLLLADATTIRSIGAWLSFAAVVGTAAGIRAGRVWLPDHRNRWWYPAVVTLMTSAGATLATAPITAFAFGQVAPVGVAANLAALPLAAVAVPAVFLSLVFGSVPAGAAGAALAGIETTARWAGAVPGGHVTVQPGPVAGLAWAVVAMVAAVVVWRFPQPRIVRRRLAALGAAATVVWVGWLAGTGSHPGDSQLTVHILSVGQGDAIAIRTPHDRWVLIDGGPSVGTWDAGRRIVLPHLKRHGADALEAVVVSHGDADHLGGVPAAIRELAPRVVIEPAQILGGNLYRDFHDAIDHANSRWWPARVGDSLVIDSVRLVVLHPSSRWMAHRVAPNENSVVLRLSFRDFDMLFTGDVGFPVESLLLERGVGRFEVLKVGHHGSSGGTGAAWLDTIRPGAAVISVGAGNRYGHPSAVVLERLARRGIPTFRTDVGGPVTIETAGRYFEVRQGRASGFWENTLCQVLASLRSSSSSSTKNACIRKRRVILPTSSTTSRSPPRSSPVRSAGPG